MQMHASLANAGLASAALALAPLSSGIERTGPELARYGNMCGPSHSDPCLAPALQGGFPFPYLFDAPGVSVVGKLSFGEDELRPVPLLVDIGIWLAAVLMGRVVVRRLRRATGAAAVKA
jgi:hypothetical protein